MSDEATAIIIRLLIHSLQRLRVCDPSSGMTTIKAESVTIVQAEQLLKKLGYPKVNGT